MLKFDDTHERVRVNRTISDECIGYAHRSYFAGVNKYRFHPIQGNCLDAHEMHLISEYLIDMNRNRNGL